MSKVNIATTLFEHGKGIRHPVAVVTNCRTLMVSADEYDLILENRSKAMGYRRQRRLDHLAKSIAADVIRMKENYRP